jgi:predicted nucleic acid-binding Zn ribbon protein
MADSEPANRKPANTAENARRRLQRKVIADWRGVYIPPDLSGYERKVGDVVGRIMKRAGIEDRLNHEEVAADWEAIVGEFLAKYSRPVSLRRGVLQVAVIQASVRYDLERRLKRDILLRLQERYGKQKVRDVKFQNG